MLRFADNPRELRARPRILDRADDWNRVASVADSGEPDDAQRRGRLAERQVHADAIWHVLIRRSAMVHDGARRPRTLGKRTTLDYREPRSTEIGAWPGPNPIWPRCGLLRAASSTRSACARIAASVRC